MMGEYVRKQDVIKYFMTNVVWHDEDSYPIEDADEKRSIITELVDGLPHADVQPVVRGRWEVVDWVEYDGHGECVHYPKEGLRCTNCKNVFKKKLLWKDNYCPNCGADMQETEE